MRIIDKIKEVKELNDISSTVGNRQKGIVSIGYYIKMTTVTVPNPIRNVNNPFGTDPFDGDYKVKFLWNKIENNKHVYTYLMEATDKLIDYMQKSQSNNIDKVLKDLFK